MRCPNCNQLMLSKYTANKCDVFYNDRDNVRIFLGDTPQAATDIKFKLKNINKFLISDKDTLTKVILKEIPRLKNIAVLK